MDKTPQDLVKERKKRIIDAIALKVPDRVPLFLSISAFGTKYGGITVKEAFENTPKWHDINEKLLLEYQPDFYGGPTAFDMETNAILDVKSYRWPGHGVDEKTPYQWVEGEYMKAEEYDALLSNPGEFIFNTYFPRICGGVEGLRTVPPMLSTLMGGPIAAFSNPAALNALKTIIKAVENNGKYMLAQLAFGPRMEAKGFPNISGMGGYVPFDAISDLLRGLKGTTLDMFQRPEKLLALEEMLLPYYTGGSAGFVGLGGGDSGEPDDLKLGFTALHRGSDGFMSLKQFEKFYWPGLKAVIMDIINRGVTPFMFFEGSWDQRLEYLKELPKGKILGWFDRTNLFKAKEIIGDTMCICGDMPLSLLQTGTPEQVRAYTKKLIDVVGKGGGFIMGSNTSLDDARPDLLKVWVDATREYGIYK
ncbi:MAG: hypothetical protein JW967_10500 [Dehalococcoidales bacterium]|nr:hypothetical protein [Dehalococcoidales bacterium]